MLSKDYYPQVIVKLTPASSDTYTCLFGGSTAINMPVAAVGICASAHNLRSVPRPVAMQPCVQGARKGSWNVSVVPTSGCVEASSA